MIEVASTRSAFSLTALAVLAATLLCTAQVSAQTVAPRALSPDETAQRRLLLEEARRASDARDHTRALELARRASEIQPSASLWQLIAAEDEALGHFADALADSARCVDAALADATTRDRDRQAATCRALGAAQRSRVGHVVIRLADGTPDTVHIRVGQHDLAPAMVGVPYPVDPGEVTVDVTAEGFEEFHGTAQVTAGGTAEVPVILRAAAIGRFEGNVAVPVQIVPGPAQPRAAACGEPGEPCCSSGCGAGLTCVEGMCSQRAPACGPSTPCAEGTRCVDGACAREWANKRWTVQFGGGLAIDTLANTPPIDGYVFSAGFAVTPWTLGPHSTVSMSPMAAIESAIGSWRGSLLFLTSLDLGARVRFGRRIAGSVTLLYAPGVVVAEERTTFSYAAYRAQAMFHLGGFGVGLTWRESGRGADSTVRAAELIIEAGF